MKYKVILYNALSTGDTDRAGTFTFYTFQSAYDCCLQWGAVNPNFFSYLWDGTQWRLY